MLHGDGAKHILGPGKRRCRHHQSDHAAIRTGLQPGDVILKAGARPKSASDVSSAARRDPWSKFV
jgi:hypothetical protein